MADQNNGNTYPETQENLIVFDPDKPVYQRLHLCVYLRDLLDDTEKTPGSGL